MGGDLMVTLRPKTTALVEKLETLNKRQLVNLLVRSLTPAGANSDWDSAMIEYVLSPYERTLADLGIPWVGDTGANDKNIRFWSGIAAEIGVESNYEEPDPFDEILDQVREHRGDYVGQVEQMIEEIREFREAREAVESAVKDALEGDSNDAEHDALVTVAVMFDIEYESDPEEED